MRKTDLFGLLAGAYASEILLQLSRSPLAEDLLRPRTASWLAKRHQLDPVGLRHILAFLALTTDIIEVRKSHYRLRVTPASFRTIRFNLEKFQEAYRRPLGDCLNALQKRKKTLYSPSDKAMTAAFSAMDGVVNKTVVETIEGFQVECLLDLGCGSGALLRALATRNSGFRGIGVDKNRTMCQRTLRLARQTKIGRKISVLAGSAPGVLARLDLTRRKRVDALYGASFLNEFFGQGDLGAIRVLVDLGRLFPGRRAWFVDYFGGLGLRELRPPPINILQDVAQIVSGQGLPPSTNTGWAKIYRSAGCKVISQRQFRNGSTKWCIHEVILPESG